MLQTSLGYKCCGQRFMIYTCIYKTNIKLILYFNKIKEEVHIYPFKTYKTSSLCYHFKPKTLAYYTYLPILNSITIYCYFFCIDCFVDCMLKHFFSQIGLLCFFGMNLSMYNKAKALAGTGFCTSVQILFPQIKL